jgi:hypothetical protein
VQQLVTPGQGRPQRLLTRRPLGEADHQQRQALVGLEFGQERGRREQADSRGGKLDSQRQAIQTVADAGHHVDCRAVQHQVGVRQPRALDEELDGSGTHQWGDGSLDFRWQPEAHAAGDQHFHVRSGE